MYNRSYRLEFYDTASPEHYTLLKPDFIVLSYDVNDRRSLMNVQHVWFKQMVQSYKQDREDIPVMLLGLKRDLRKDGPGVLHPQEVSDRRFVSGGHSKLTSQLQGLKVAQDLRCDRYAECSATTGELMNEVIEDIARTAAKTTTIAGGLSNGGCAVM